MKICKKKNCYNKVQLQTNNIYNVLFKIELLQKIWLSLLNKG